MLRWNLSQMRLNTNELFWPTKLIQAIRETIDCVKFQTVQNVYGNKDRCSFHGLGS